MTSLADIFTMEKALVKIIIGHKVIILSTDFQNFVALYKK